MVESTTAAENPAADPIDRRMTAEQVLFFQHSCHMMTTRQYKANWPRVMFNRRFGFWPTIGINDVVPVEPTSEFEHWVRQNSSKPDRGTDGYAGKIDSLVLRYGLSDEDRDWLRKLAAQESRTKPKRDDAPASAGPLARRISALISRWEAVSRDLKNGRAIVASRRLDACIDELQAVVATDAPIETTR